MRIISQLVPSGKPVSTDIEATRQPGKNTWEIPAWGHPLALGVYPFFVTKNRRLIPVGTAFCISSLGVSITALHNTLEAARRYCENDFMRQMDTLSAGYTMKDIGMALFHHQALPGGTLSGNISSLEFIEGAPPTDVGYVSPQFQSGFPYLPLPISFAVPRIGSRVVCVGFSDLPVPDGGLSLDDIQCGRINLLDAYQHRLLAVEGRVTRIFTQRFENGFIGGPCFTIDAEINHGMSGGPVFSENGYVCGINSAGATNFFGKPASIVSLFYPALVMNVRFGGQIGHVRITSNRRLIELIAQGAVITDGSENLVTIRSDSGESLLGPTIHGEDADCIYDDFQGFQEGRHATRESKDVYRFNHKRRKGN
jgi:hypothetical protein